MSRIKLKLPEPQQFIFTTDIEPRISDINYGNHLGHDHLISLLHEVRLRFLKQHGFSEFDIAGTSIIMADLAIVYKAEVNYGEALAKKSLYLNNIKQSTFFYGNLDFLRLHQLSTNFKQILPSISLFSPSATRHKMQADLS